MSFQYIGKEIGMMDWFTDGGKSHLTTDEVLALSREEAIVLAHLREHGPCFINDLYQALCNEKQSAEVVCGAFWRLMDRRAVMLAPDLRIEATARVPLGILHA